MTDDITPEIIEAFEARNPRHKQMTDVEYSNRILAFAAGWNARAATLSPSDDAVKAKVARLMADGTLFAAGIEGARPAMKAATNPEAATEIEAHMAACRDAIAERERDDLVRVGALKESGDSEQDTLEGVAARREDGE